MKKEETDKMVTSSARDTNIDRQNIIWLSAMKIGKLSGCHQLPNRSFWFNGYQFPVCARCTGVFIGNILATAMLFIYVIKPQFCIIGCLILFVDWLIQRLNICESTNTRRSITGVIGGYALTSMCFNVLKLIT